MRVLIDGKPHPLLNAAPIGVASVVGEIDAVLEHRGRGIQQILINDEPWSLERLDDELDTLAVADVTTLDVRTESMGVLVDQSLVEIQDVIDELPSACHSLAALLNSPDREAALRGYVDLVEIWEDLLDRHRQALDALKVRPATVSVDGVPLDTWQDRSRQIVEQGTALASAGDAAGLADLLTYELIRYAEEEASVLEQLRLLTRSAPSG